MRTPVIRCAAALTTVFALCAGPADAQAGGANNVVIVGNSTDGTAVARSNLQAAPVGADTVSSTNLASATGENCTGCRTVAAAFQAIFITRRAHTITPNNVALAANANCTGCETYAYAFQYALTTPGPVLIDADGHEALTALRQEIAAAVGSGLALDALDARMRELAVTFQALVDEHLSPTSALSGAKVNERADRG